MAKPEIDQEKRRVFLRSLGNDELLQLLDRAIGLLPRARLATLIKGYAKPSNLKPAEYARAAPPKDSWPGSAWSVRRRWLMGDGQGSVIRARRAGVVAGKR